MISYHLVFYYISFYHEYHFTVYDIASKGSRLEVGVLGVRELMRNLVAFSQRPQAFAQSSRASDSAVSRCGYSDKNALFWI